MPDFPNELVEAAAVVCYSLAPEHDTSTYPHGYVPYDEARPSSRENARADALEVLTALYPLIEQRVIDRLAREAGENPYPEFHLPEHDGATGYADPCHAAWDEGAACGVAAAQEREGTARLVADHWRKAMLDAGDERMPARATAHPLCMVLAALDGETRPEHLGITPESDEWHVLSAALSEGTPE